MGFNYSFLTDMFDNWEFAHLVFGNIELELLFCHSALTVRLTLTVLLAKQHNYLSQRLVFIYFFVVIFSEVASLPFLLVLYFISAIYFFEH
jgi:hypothetical protein